MQKGERVLLCVDNWHSELTIKACQKILEKYGVKYEIKMIDRGPIPQWVGADEVAYYLFRTKELAEWFIKIQRIPFITPEILVSPAHAMPIEVINAIDEWTSKRIRSAKRNL